MLFSPTSKVYLKEKTDKNKRLDIKQLSLPKTIKSRQAYVCKYEFNMNINIDILVLKVIVAVEKSIFNKN